MKIDTFMIVMLIIIAALIAIIIATAIKTHYLQDQQIKLARSEFNFDDDDDDSYAEDDEYEPDDDSGYYYVNRSGQHCKYQAPIN